jgi:hypothetical protein
MSKVEKLAVGGNQTNEKSKETYFLMFFFFFFFGLCPTPLMDKYKLVENQI